ncbi:MAG: helix-hairpin-helix domain-containing protein [Chitinophagales bacterium]
MFKYHFSPTIHLFVVLLALIVNQWQSVYAQIPTSDLETIEQLLERLAEDAEDDRSTDFNTILESLEDYRLNPLNLNTASFEELSELQFLSSQQIIALLAYRETLEKFVTVYELQVVNGFDLITAKLLANFVVVDEPREKIPIKELLLEGKNQLFLQYQQTLENQQGYLKLDTLEDGTAVSKFKGSPAKLTLRYRYNYGTRLSYGFTAEKDAGEEFFKGSQKRGFDFYSGHVYMRDVGPFKHLALGDFEVKFGQGLAVWSGFGTRKGEDVLNLFRQEFPLKKYTSVNETSFFRGAAATVGGEKWEATAFVSYKAIDGNVLLGVRDTLDVLDEEVLQFTSIQVAGLHRTDAELADRKAIQRFDTGASIHYKNKDFSLGGNAFFSKFNAPLQPSNDAYNRFRFNGDQLLNLSVDYRWLLSRLALWGETAVSDNGAMATLHGALVEVADQISVGMLYRNYSKKYQSLNANAFGESSRPQNEEGFYIGAEILPVPQFRLQVYADVFQHPFLKFRVDGPSRGVEYFAQLNYSLNRNVEMYARYRNENKLQNAPANSENSINVLSHRQKSDFRYNIDYRASYRLRFKSRLQWSWFDNGVTAKQRGFFLSQDVKYTLAKMPLDLTARFALFDTQSFDTRIYAYESSVLYDFSIPFFADRGSRFYMMAKYEFSRYVHCWLRFAQTYTANQETISSGNNLINGNVQSEIKAMVRLKW